MIVASNRGPVEFHEGDNGILEGRRGAGGLVSTLLPIMETVKGTWIASTMTQGDKVAAEKFPDGRVPVPEDEPKFWVPFVSVDPERYEDYYSVISNPLLWFVQHYMWNPPYTPEIDDKIHKAWKNGYVHVNRRFADKVVEESNSNDKEALIILQDYHLYLCPAYIREKLEDTFLSQFIHIPWPQPEYFCILPDYMEEAIVTGLLSNDIVGFHIEKYVNNFLRTCEAYADQVDFENNTVHYEGREILVKSYPISVDYEGLEELSKTDEVLKKEKTIHEIKGDAFLIYRTDRADLSKNIIRGFKAYDLFLEKHPEFHGKVKFLTTGKPTRQQINEYRDYRMEIHKVVGHINAKYSKEGWKPIEEIFKADYLLVTAAFKHYDCLMVNPICDGMNIVSKEGSVVNENNGVLILSEHAGSYEELKDYSLNVNPFDVTQTAEALYQAVTMDENEREKRINGLKGIINERNIYHWITEQFKDIEEFFNNNKSI
ncbi:alpha,alpha-trehalose-phosphate synthase (UDP-forming) [Methanobacterium aggregans]|uniref:alpha,alpha-trehalose-phosphate synthase (UDP-forming) n=1 Tax=Methanobacterium aggregans TaxID=1615586 RepID=UPI001FDABF61|nr:trehalose-6-phosphate synthase [Methanobacterium aggregans]MBP2044826.1 trehalose 6-phosphate synthase [Methanobacterium aggregans]